MVRAIVNMDVAQLALYVHVLLLLVGISIERREVALHVQLQQPAVPPPIVWRMARASALSRVRSPRSMTSTLRQFMTPAARLCTPMVIRW